MTRHFVKVLRKLPISIEPKPAEPGSTAFEYLQENRKFGDIYDDPDLWMIIDHGHPDGGRIYVFKDHSSVVGPRTHPITYPMR